MSGDNPKDLLSKIDVRLNGLFGELGKALEEALSRLEEGGGEVTRSQSFESPRGPMRAEAGLRVRIGGIEVSKEPKRPEPINAGQQTANSKIPVREVSATTIIDGSTWCLTAELPGVSEQALTLKIANDLLEISAESSGRSYFGQFEVPAGLEISDIEISMKNGVLDLTATLPKGVNT